MGETPSTAVFTRNRCPSRDTAYHGELPRGDPAGRSNKTDGVSMSICVPLGAIRAAIRRLSCERKNNSCPSARQTGHEPPAVEICTLCARSGNVCT